MKKYVFEIEITERDLEGDEFWGTVIDEDPTGITGVTELIIHGILNQMGGYKQFDDVKKMVTLKSYTDNGI